MTPTLRAAHVGLWLGLLTCAGCSPSFPESNAATRAVEAVAQPRASLADVARAIQAAIDGGQDPLLGSFTTEERSELAALYGTDQYSPLWVDAEGRPTDNARRALGLLTGAADDGLDPADYRAGPLDQLVGKIAAAASPQVEDLAALDVGLSASSLRYVRELHLSRLDPHTMGFRVTVPADKHDFVMLLRSALASDEISQLAADLAPPFAQYRALRGMLARYRTLAADTTLDPLPASGVTVHPGEQYVATDALRRRLVSLGDLPENAPAGPESSTYEEPLVGGVKRFQARHGLTADGVLGKNTQEALHVPLASRVRQIEFALERLRWLPDLGDDRFLAVNIPMFRLWVWDSIPPDGAPLFGMGVIVGRALNTRTPVFLEEMSHIIFRPYWNVPASITVKEILPAIKRDPDYLRRQDMEIVQGAGDDAQVVAATDENLALLRRGALRLRQRPGPKNALGLVKFVFPNDADVYMHATPAPELFSRARRDFSHGCVRVEDPIALAEWALDGQAEWTRERIVAAMNATQSRRVNLARPIQVILFYITAVVMPEDGTIHFVEDIYGHDKRLEQALTRRQSARMTPVH